MAKVERDRWRFHNEQKTWREWNGKYWEAIPHEDVGDVIHHQVKSFIKTDTWIENCLKSLERELRHRQWMPQSQSVRAFANGVVDMETLALTPHNPEHYNTSIIHRDWWQPDGEPIKDPLEALRQYCPHIYDAWHHAMGGDERKILKLLAICNGVLAWRFSTLQKFIHLIGKPGTGKGTFSRILGSLVGEENTKASKLSRLGGEYDVAHWIDSQLLTLPDEGNKYSEDALDTIKSMTGGDAIPYRQIFKEVGSSPFYGTLLIISNDPIFRGETGAIKRRLCLVEFDIPIINRNSLAEELMLREIPRLTYCALSMPSLKVDAIVNGLGEHEIPSFNSKAWELETAENSVADFLDTELVPISNCKVYVKDVYSEYTKFCSHTGQKAVAMNKFSSRLITASDFVGWEIERGKARNGSYIIGVDIREEIKHQHIPTPSEVFKKAEKAYSPNQPSQPSQPDRARVPAVTPIVTEPSQEPSQPSQEQIPIDFSASARVEAPIPSPSPSKTECDDTGDDTVMVDVTAGMPTQQGRDGCDDTLGGCRSENEQPEKTEPLSDPWRSAPTTEKSVSNDFIPPPWGCPGMKVKIKDLDDGVQNEGMLIRLLDDGGWTVFWENIKIVSDHSQEELSPLSDGDNPNVHQESEGRSNETAQPDSSTTQSEVSADDLSTQEVREPIPVATKTEDDLPYSLGELLWIKHSEGKLPAMITGLPDESGKWECKYLFRLKWRTDRFEPDGLEKRPSGNYSIDDKVLTVTPGTECMEAIITGVQDDEGEWEVMINLDGKWHEGYRYPPEELRPR
ncbi:DUF5906 domain-containing protein [Roseofilum reptotaenium CS-1145]|uniref:SF3 helicase domain-containing protein n=1 Tax=Roseofilum reptotaenium AO1-A TaxID=1925591 RepID=A0A1L9QT25_9CYAN|nr:DUF5906 domain-containing protein [Roseofilum reptotaenium]MDB9518238.1 DUF5906 domain-containing protein [Roseofilum reptotaenium CS-1145]OJJ25824.1 hypothetical protein BI308_09935 [Roseofilum reptotaenium AO1-A]